MCVLLISIWLVACVSFIFLKNSSLSCFFRRPPAIEILSWRVLLASSWLYTKWSRPCTRTTNIDSTVVSEHCRRRTRWRNPFSNTWCSSTPQSGSMLDLSKRLERTSGATRRKNDAPGSQSQDWKHQIWSQCLVPFAHKDECSSGGLRGPGGQSITLRRINDLHRDKQYQ